MFIAAAAFCAIVEESVDLDNCTFFEDSFGPYETEAECEERAEEMRSFISNTPLIIENVRIILQSYRITGVGYCYEDTPPGVLL
jgi:hypothetical protein